MERVISDMCNLFLQHFRYPCDNRPVKNVVDNDITDKPTNEVFILQRKSRKRHKLTGFTS